MTATDRSGSSVVVVATPVLGNMTLRHCNVLSFQLPTCKLLQYGSGCHRPHLSMSYVNSLLDFHVKVQ